MLLFVEPLNLAKTSIKSVNIVIIQPFCSNSQKVHTYIFISFGQKAILSIPPRVKSALGWLTLELWNFVSVLKLSFIVAFIFMLYKTWKQKLKEEIQYYQKRPTFDKLYYLKCVQIEFE